MAYCLKLYDWACLGRVRHLTLGEYEYTRKFRLCAYTSIITCFILLFSAAENLQAKYSLKIHLSL